MGDAKSDALLETAAEIYAELAVVVAAWPMLPENVRSAILLLVDHP